MSATHKLNGNTQNGSGQNKPRLAVFKFASCDGCQLSLLDAEDELLAVAGAVEIAYFVEARRQTLDGPYDVTLVEGSVTTPEEVERIQHVRQQSKFLVAIGACATAGGIQSLKNWQNVDNFINAVYAHPNYITTLKTSLPISEYVAVDFELRGCPINKYQLLDCLQTCQTLVVVDAVKSGAPPGTVHSHVWYPGLVKSRGIERVSQHGIGVNDMLQLAAQFDQLPELVILWGIEVACTEPGQAVSASVAYAFPDVVKGLYAELQRMVRVSIG